MEQRDCQQKQWPGGFKEKVLHLTLDGNLDHHFWAFLEELIRACLVPFLALRTLGRNDPLGKTW